MTTNFETIHVTKEIHAVASLVASRLGLSVDLYIESLVREHALPQIAESLGLTVTAPVAPTPSPAWTGLESTQLAAKPEPAKPEPAKPKRRKKTRKSWVCPCCNKKIRPQGNKVHFLSCCTKAGLTVREIATFCHGDSALMRMYGCDVDATIDEIEAAIRQLAENLRMSKTLVDSSEHSSTNRQRLTAKSRLRK